MGTPRKAHARCLLLVCTAGLAAVAQAEVLKPAPARLGPASITPTLTLREEYDSNLFRQHDDVTESWVQVMLLHMQALAQDGPHEYTLDYRGEAGFVDNSSADDYVDHAVTVDGKWDMATRHRAQLMAGYLRDHDRRGTAYFQGDQALLIDEPLRFSEEMFLGRYSYGARNAQGRLDFEVKGTNKTYLNFRELTRRNDLTHVYGTVTFLWRVAGSLRGLLETTQGNVNYRHDPDKVDGALDVRDSDYARYLAGVTWELAGKTTGTLKLGHATKDFSDRDRKDFSGTSWSGELTWNPVSYSRLTLATGRRTDEAYGRGDFIDATDWGLIWEHSWSDRIETSLRYRHSDETYEEDPDGRDDTIQNYGFDIDYAMRRWLAIGLFYTREQRDSNIRQYDFPRDYAGLTLRISL
jgi:hypothetical protein